MEKTEEITDSSPMPFGMHKGKAMIKVPAPYLLWLHNNVCDHNGVRKYILDNLEAIKKEAGQTRRR